MTGESQAKRRLLILTRDTAGPTYRLRVAPFLPALARRGVEADVVELPDATLARLRVLRRARRYDAVVLHKKTLSVIQGVMFDRYCPRVIYDFDDAILYKARSPEQPDRGRWRRFRRTVRRADVVIAGNDLLARHARQAGAREVRVIPTCLDPSRYAPKVDYGLGSPTRMVWIGSSSTLEQVAGFADALNAMGRAIDGLTFRIIADDTLALKDLAVEAIPWSLEDEARLLAEADFAVAPLPDTPFTRGKCAFKVLQYLAAALPVITSPVGVNAQYVADGRTGLWARTPDEWASRAARLVADRALRERLGQAGRRFVEQRMDVRLWQDAYCQAVCLALPGAGA